MKRSCFAILILLLLPIANTAFASEASVDIKGTSPDSKLSGKIIFTEVTDGLKLIGDFHGVPPGKHGFHVHETGDCGDSGKAAGSHFNPDSVPHGHLIKNGFTSAHAGDLGNLEIAQDGSGHVETVLPGLALKEGKYAVAGRSVIVHEKEDDFGQPTGNAGGRIGCGVIEVTHD